MEGRAMSHSKEEGGGHEVLSLPVLAKSWG